MEGEFEKVHGLKYKLSNPILEDRSEQATYSLDTVADYGILDCEQSPVSLYLGNKDDMYNLNIMKTHVHKNILQVRMVKEHTSNSQTSMVAFVEPYTGCLSKHLESAQLGHAAGSSSTVQMIPGFSLQDIISQIIDGLGDLWKFGRYHGNLTLENTLYNKTVDGNIIIKLSCFKYKGNKPFELCKMEDCITLGGCLDEICTIAKNRNASNYSKPLDLTQIYDLAEKLKTVTSESVLNLSGEGIKCQTFFWGTRRRKKYFIYEILRALGYEAFKTYIRTLRFFDKDKWDDDAYDGYRDAMIKHRKGAMAGQYIAYKGDDNLDFVLFVCGAYTHEDEIKRKNHLLRSFDQVMQARHPRLAYDFTEAQVKYTRNPGGMQQVWK